MPAPPPFDEEAGPTPAAKSSDTPIDFFKLLFTDNLVDVIVEETNVYISQKGYLGYLGMNIAMGIVGLPELQDYWT